MDTLLNLETLMSQENSEKSASPQGRWIQHLMPFGGVIPIVNDNKVTITFSESFTSPYLVFEHLAILESITEDQQVYLNINSPGGNVDLGLMLANGIKQCRGEVTTIAVGFCASAGTIAWAAGKHRLMAPGAYLMFHGPLTSMGGMMNNQMLASDITYTADVFNTFLKDMKDNNILSEEELDSIITKNLDVFIPQIVYDKRMGVA